MCNRRTVLTGIAATVAAPTVAAASTEPDPIFAAIEAHRAAALDWYRQVDVEFALDEILPYERKHWRGNDESLNDPNFGKGDDPRWVACQRASHAAFSRFEEVSADLTDVIPTTRAGVVALLDYMHAFASGEVKTDHDCCSSVDDLPDDLIDKDFVDSRGRPIEMPFHGWIVSNVRIAIDRIGAA